MNFIYTERRAAGWIGGALMFLAIAQPASAQSRTPAPQSLGVTTGQRVSVTAVDGAVSSGIVGQHSSTSLTLSTTSGERTLPASEIRLIRHRDSLANGAIIGAAIGAGAISPLAGLYLGGDETPEPGTAAGLFAVGAAAGVVGGLLVDSLRTRVLYRAPGPASVAIAPAVVKGGGGVRVSVRW
jgi:hypothetical protein